MAPKTTSGSGFHLIFPFSVVDLVDNAINIENEKCDLKVEKFKKYLNELREFPTYRSLICCGRRGPVPLCQNSLNDRRTGALCCCDTKLSSTTRLSGIHSMSADNISHFFDKVTDTMLDLVNIEYEDNILHDAMLLS